MGLVDEFPADPFTPSLGYAATCQLPLSLPWGREFITLGSCFSVSTQSAKGKLDRARTAFSAESLRESRLVFTSGALGEVTGADTSGASSATSHTDFSISAEVGGSLLGASGRGKYEESASSNSSNVQSSFRSTYRGGTVRFLQDPGLSAEAVSILRSSKDQGTAEQAFKDAYGEYYVAAYILGGSNATMLAGATAAESYSSSLQVSFTIKILFAKIHGSFEKHEERGHASAVGFLAAYDTLERVAVDYGVGKPGASSYSNMIEDAMANRERGDTLAGRVEAKMREVGLRHGAFVSWKKCEEICEAGLVGELLLLPYSGLREYVEAIHSSN